MQWVDTLVIDLNYYSLTAFHFLMWSSSYVLFLAKNGAISPKLQKAGLYQRPEKRLYFCI